MVLWWMGKMILRILIKELRPLNGMQKDTTGWTIKIVLTVLQTIMSSALFELLEGI